MISTASVRRSFEAATSINSQHKLSTLPVASSDLSFISPDGLIASSETLGWQNLLAVELQQNTAVWTMPPVNGHCIIVQLGPAIAVSAGIADHSFEQTLKPGEIVIVPAGLSLHWQQRDTGGNRMLFIFLHPNFLRTTAETIELDYSQISIAPQFGIADEHIRHIGMSLQCELQD